MVVLVVVLALLLASAGGAIVVPAVLGLTPERGRMRAQAASLLRGGLVIGVLERLAVAGSVLLGHPEGVAIVVAVKGLGRYPELRGAATARTGAAGPVAVQGDPPTDPQARAAQEQAAQEQAAKERAAQEQAAELSAAVSERFIIGTLASLVWAVACGAGGLWWLAQLA
ncbi:hypothetical protein [Miniimonas arenae]|nr:hypothetical protein [Miniimonas arenae]